MQTFGEKWREFSDQVLSRVPERTPIPAETVFYSGAAALLHLLLTNDCDTQWLNEVHQELEAHFTMGASNAGQVPAAAGHD